MAKVRPVLNVAIRSSWTSSADIVLPRSCLSSWEVILCPNFNDVFLITSGAIAVGSWSAMIIASLSARTSASILTTNAVAAILGFAFSPESFSAFGPIRLWASSKNITWRGLLLPSFLLRGFTFKVSRISVVSISVKKFAGPLPIASSSMTTGRVNHSSGARDDSATLNTSPISRDNKLPMRTWRTDFRFPLISPS